MQIVYVFNNHHFCDDVFKHLYDVMVEREYECYKITRGDLENPNEETDRIADIVKDKKVILITSDHSDYSNYAIKVLSPAKKFYAMHDLGIHRVDDNMSAGWHVLLPHMMWKAMYDKFDLDGIDIIGHGKFWQDQQEIEYETVFFASLLYVYLQRKPESFYNDFKNIIDKNIPIKFPKVDGLEKLTNFLKKKGVKLIDHNLESFDVLLKCNTAIANSASSICVEAAMLGCNAINLGAGYGPLYSGLGILSTSPKNFNKNMLKPRRKNQMNEFKFDLEKTINIVTSPQT